MNKILVLGLIIIAAVILTNNSQITFSKTSTDTTPLSLLVWRDRIGETLLQPIIIFCSLICISVLVRDFRWI